MILPSLVVSDTSPVSALVVMGFLKEELIEAAARQAGEDSSG